MQAACSDAGAARQPVLVLTPASAKFEQVGTDWRVVVRMNHTTKWGDNPYTATCVIGWIEPKATVKSVEMKPGSQ